ncbi:MAG: hypothetical protein ABI740_09060 [Alphaproteobacteria bacterium]
MWDAVVPPKQEKSILKVLRAYQSNPALGGEMLALRLADGLGGGCKAAGPMVGATVTMVDHGHEADVTFAGDDWRVW